MFKKLFAGVVFLSGVSLAHIKPAPHGHIGFWHIEEFLLIGGLLTLGAVGLLTLLRLRRASR